MRERGEMYSRAGRHKGDLTSHARKASVESGFLREASRESDKELDRALFESARDQEVRNYFAERGLAINSPGDLVKATIAICLTEDKHFLDGYTPPEGEFVHEQPDFILQFRTGEGEKTVDLAFKVVNCDKPTDIDLDLKKAREIEDRDGNQLTMLEITASDYWAEVSVLLARKIEGEAKKGLEGVSVADIRERLKDKSDPTIENVVGDIGQKLMH